jgi:hypothetical protein
MTVAIDTAMPSLEIIRPNEGGATSGTANVTWIGSDLDSGVLGYSLKLDNGLWSDLITASNFEFAGLVNGPHSVHVRVTDLAGNTAERMVNFTADTIPPEVVIRSPDGSDAPIGSKITADFSEAMDQANTSIAVSGVTGTISWVGNQIVFTPDANMVYNTTFTVTVNGRDAVGNPLHTTTWSFNTVAGKGTLSGTVNGPDGKPIAGATVYLGDQNTTTDAQGRYFFNATQGPYTLVVKDPGMVDQTKQVTIVPDQATDSGTVSLSKAPGIDAWVWILVVLAIVIVLVVAFVMYRRRSGEKK